MACWHVCRIAPADGGDKVWINKRLRIMGMSGSPHIRNIILPHFYGENVSTLNNSPKILCAFLKMPDRP